MFFFLYGFRQLERQAIGTVVVIWRGEQSFCYGCFRAAENKADVCRAELVAVGR